MHRQQKFSENVFSQARNSILFYATATATTTTIQIIITIAKLATIATTIGTNCLTRRRLLSNLIALIKQQQPDRNNNNNNNKQVLQSTIFKCTNI